VTEAPPSRFKVIERGRRLEVIDTRNGEPAASSPSTSSGNRPALSWPRQVRFDGGSELTTHPLYDDHGPRTLPIDPGAVATIGKARLGAAVVAITLVILLIAYPWLLLVLFLLLGSRWRAAFRKRVTAWLDRYDEARSPNL